MTCRLRPPSSTTPEFDAEVQSYADFRDRLDQAGLEDVRLSTNVGATPTFDPSSPDPARRDAALAFLQSRVRITHALRGTLMAGPIVMPYGAYPMSSAGKPLWSDVLQDWAAIGYQAALPTLIELASFAAELGVKLAIEPVDHWEQPSPCTLNDVLRILDGVPNAQLGVCIDSAHMVLGSQGPAFFAANTAILASQGRVHSIHISAPDRGELADSWIPWQQFLRPVLQNYSGPLLVEVFNAIPEFVNSLRLTRRKFGIPGLDTNPSAINAYKVAEQAIARVRHEVQLARLPA